MIYQWVTYQIWRILILKERGNALVSAVGWYSKSVMDKNQKIVFSSLLSDGEEKIEIRKMGDRIRISIDLGLFGRSADEDTKLASN